MYCYIFYNSVYQYVIISAVYYVKYIRIYSNIFGI